MLQIQDTELLANKWQGSNRLFARNSIIYSNLFRLASKHYPLVRLAEMCGKCWCPSGGLEDLAVVVTCQRRTELTSGASQP